jgi:hypothetical protein
VYSERDGERGHSEDTGGETMRVEGETVGEEDLLF